MYAMIFRAHSDTRYLVLLLGLVTALYALVGYFRKQPVDKRALTLLRVFAVIIDLQIVLGLGTLLYRGFYPQLMGHLVMMVAAAAVAHLGVVRLKKAAQPTPGYGIVLASSVIPLLLIVGGILAIGRQVI